MAARKNPNVSTEPRRINKTSKYPYQELTLAELAAARGKMDKLIKDEIGFASYIDRESWLKLMGSKARLEDFYS